MSNFLILLLVVLVAAAVLPFTLDILMFLGSILGSIILIALGVVAVYMIYIVVVSLLSGDSFW